MKYKGQKFSCAFKVKLLTLIRKLRAYILALRNESAVVYGALPGHGNHLGIRSVELTIRDGVALCRHRLLIEVARSSPIH